MTLKSIRAGMFIALGCIIYLSAPSVLIGAILFSLGLLCIGLTESYLYTGQIHKLIEDDRKPMDLLWIFLGNLMGVALMAIPAIHLSDIGASARLVAITKMSQPMIITFIQSIWCGMLMTMATRKDTPKYITIGCVTAFVLGGFNHSIADMFYYFAYGNVWLTVPRLLCTAIGNLIGGLLPVLKPAPK